MIEQQRFAYLKALGITVWMPRQAVVENDSREESGESASSPGISKHQSRASAQHKPDSQPELESLLQSLSKQEPAASEPVANSNVSSSMPDQSAEPVPHTDGMDWEALRRQVTACTRCQLHQSRTQTVFGTGDEAAGCMIIGEAPGAEEDRQGLPFVGRAGQLLNNMLAAIGLQRDSVYIANMLKCRPPNNRDPLPEEVAACRGYLERQIELIDPALILVVGRVAAQNLLQTKDSLARLRGRRHRLPGLGTPVIVTYHPAYLLRQPRDKRKAWDDLKQVARILSRTP